MRGLSAQELWRNRRKSWIQYRAHTWRTCQNQSIAFLKNEATKWRLNCYVNKARIQFETNHEVWVQAEAPDATACIGSNPQDRESFPCSRSVWESVKSSNWVGESINASEINDSCGWLTLTTISVTLMSSRCIRLLYNLFSAADGVARVES